MIQHCICVRARRRGRGRPVRRGRGRGIHVRRVLDGGPEPLPVAVLVVRRTQLDVQQPPPERMLLVHLGRLRGFLQPGTGRPSGPVSSFGAIKS